MKALIKQTNIDEEYYSSEKCYITEISNSCEDPNVSIARARVKVGVTTRWHYLIDTVERYYILEGEGKLELADLAQQIVSTGDIAIIPALCKQRITNTGNTDLIFLAICSPRFRQENYRESVQPDTG